MAAPKNPGQITTTDLDWIARWQRVARRIRVPLGFLAAILYLFELWRRAPQPAAIAWSLALVLPGLWLRALCIRLRQKESRTHRHRPLRAHAQPALSRLHRSSPPVLRWRCSAGRLPWSLAVGFAVIYIPVIASEERFLRATFPAFDAYCRIVPRIIPRILPAKQLVHKDLDSLGEEVAESASGGFSLELYLRHREYNAAIGAALLYLSLLFLRPAMEAILHGAR